MAENFPTTPTGYVVLPAGSRLQPKGEPPVEVAWVAVVGVRHGAQQISLAEATLLQARRVIRGDDRPEFGAAMLLYLAQIGFRPAGGGDHLRWPPIRDGAIEQDRRCWRRPYLFALTSHDLYSRMLPDAEAALLWDETAADASLVPRDRRVRHAAALSKLPPGASLRTDDEALANAVRWHTGMFAYPLGEPAGSPAVREEAVHLVREWATAPRSHRLSDALADWIFGKARVGDVEALGTVLQMLQEGHVLTHATIRHHQHHALDELRASGAPRWEQLLADATGLHELLYRATPLFGFETWQFTAQPDGALRVWPPEIVNVGWQALGRWGWLDSLMAACGRRDLAAAQRQLDRLRQELALLATPLVDPPEDHLVFDVQTDEGWKAVDLERYESRRQPADKELEKREVLTIVRGALTDRQWDAWYPYKMEELNYQEIATMLRISKPRVSQLVREAEQALQQDPRLKDWLTG